MLKEILPLDKGIVQRHSKSDSCYRKATRR
jgi:hypothetical protein